MNYRCITSFRKSILWAYEEGNVIDQETYDRLKPEQQKNFEATTETGNPIVDFLDNRIEDSNADDKD